MTAYSWIAPASAPWSSSINWNPFSGGPPRFNTDSADISATGTTYTVTLDVNETIGALTVNSAEATLALGTNTLTVTNAGSLAGTVTVTAGTISIAGGTLSATGGISVASGAVITDSGILFGTISGAGLIQASGGTLRIESAVLGSATGLGINTSAVLRLDSSVASGAVITFLSSTAGTTLDLTAISGNVLVGFDGTIAGLNVGSSATVATNQIDLAGLTTANLTGASLDTSSDVLTVTTTGGSFTLQLSGSYAPGTFVDWIADGATTGSDLFLSTVACYCRGTLILTDRGEVPVEALAIGDRVITLSGAARPIRWIGRRAYDGRFVAGNRQVLPIRITAGALSDDVPVRDLWLSPEHSLYFDGVLAQAAHLVNGATVERVEHVKRVEYFHVELDSHDVIFANGTPAESFVDCDNRLMFSNGAEYAVLYPNDDRPRWEFCVPRLEWDSEELTEIRAALQWRAEALGHDRDRDPDLHLIVDGRVVRPAAIRPGVYRFAVPAGGAAVWLASRSSVPAETDAASRDQRRLGVAVERMLLCDGDLSIEAWSGHAALRDGFYDDESGHRWTDGLARLPKAWLRLFAGEAALDVHLAPSELTYRREPAVRTRSAA